MASRLAGRLRIRRQFSTWQLKVNGDGAVGLWGRTVFFSGTKDTGLSFSIVCVVRGLQPLLLPVPVTNTQVHMTWLHCSSILGAKDLSKPCWRQGKICSPFSPFLHDPERQRRHAPFLCPFLPLSQSPHRPSQGWGEAQQWSKTSRD